MPRTPTAGPPVLLALLAVLTACSGHPAARSAATAPARSVPPPSTAPATAAVTPVPTVLPTGPARTPTAPPRRSPVPTVPVVPVATSSPLPLPAGPAASPAPPPSSGLAALDWAQRPLPAGTCAGGRPGTAVAGDLGDGRESVALPVSCPGTGHDAVLVFTGTAAAPRLLGDALAPESGGTVHAVLVREAHLVVTSVEPGQGGGEAVAVTARWQVRAAALARTDRWEDPASVLDVDGPTD